MTKKDNPRFYISAYGMACRMGFKGTVQAWLDSLKGEKGDAFTYEDFTAAQLAELTAGIQTDLQAVIEERVAAALAALRGDAQTQADSILASCTAAAQDARESAGAAQTARAGAEAAAVNASGAANTATERATTALNAAILARSWAAGGMNVRDGEDTDNAAYYAGQSAEIYRQQKAFMDVMDTLTTAVGELRIQLNQIADQVAAIQTQADTASDSVESVSELQERLGDVKATMDLIDQTLDSVNEGESTDG